MWLIRGQEILESKPSITLLFFLFYCRYFELGQEPKVSSCSISLLFSSRLNTCYQSVSFKWEERKGFYDSFDGGQMKQIVIDPGKRMD